MSSQVIYEEFASSKLGEKRQIKIQLPRGYENDTDKSYPLFIVLDGDYLFEAVAGNVDYYSYWEDMPEAVVVGVRLLPSLTGFFELIIERGKSLSLLNQLLLEQL